jgi:hypothetical protein
MSSTKEKAKEMDLGLYGGPGATSKNFSNYEFFVLAKVFPHPAAMLLFYSSYQ